MMCTTKRVLFFISSIFVLCLRFSSVSSQIIDCMQKYGRTCPYVPAPLGRIPRCARPGDTFCEYPDDYPGELIMFLAKQAKFNTRTLVTDETKDDFTLTEGPYPAAKYPQTHYEDIELTTAKQNDQQWLHSDLMPPFLNNSAHFPGQHFENSGQPLRYKYTANIPQYFHHPRNIPSLTFLGPHSQFSSSPAFHHFRSNSVWKRSPELEFMHERVKRSESFRRFMRKIRESPFKKNSTEDTLPRRFKRQNDDSNSESLCQTRSSFIMPRAALNKDGVWMYIVNMEQNQEKYTQLVRSEVCASQTCSSLCGLPDGYTSKCEQKYIQKRLIALQQEGDQLYTDIFWIPSCCLCTIRRT